MEEVPLLRHVSRCCGSSCRGASLPLWGRSFALGQMISFLIAGTGVSSSFLVEWGVSVPTTQSALNYALLLCTYLGYRGATRGWGSLSRLRLPWWKYALLGALDVEANFLIGELPRISSSLRVVTLIRPTYSSACVSLHKYHECDADRLLDDPLRYGALLVVLRRAISGAWLGRHVLL